MADAEKAEESDTEGEDTEDAEGSEGAEDAGDAEDTGDTEDTEDAEYTGDADERTASPAADDCTLTVDLSEEQDYPLSLRGLMAGFRTAPAAEAEVQTEAEAQVEAEQTEVGNAADAVAADMPEEIPAGSDAEAAEPAAASDDEAFEDEIIENEAVEAAAAEVEVTMAAPEPAVEAPTPAIGPEAAPAESVAFDDALLSVEETGEDWLITPVASFDKTEIVVGGVYTIAFINCTVEVPVAMPEQTFEGATDYITVKVEAGEGAFPEGTTMQLTDIEDEGVLTDIGDAAVTDNFVEVKRVHAVDITFRDGQGNEIEPLIPISVVISVREIEQDQEAVVVHVDDDGNAEVVEGTEALPDADGALTEAPAAVEDQPEDQDGDAAPGAESVVEEAPAESVSFMADAFSIYAMVVTQKIETKIITAEGETYNITVSYGPEAEIPMGAALSVSEIEGDAAQDYLERTEETLEKTQVVTCARFFDIKIMDGETEVQPAVPVTVQAVLADETRDEAAVPCAVHFADETVGQPDVVEAAETGETVVFRAAGFSVWGVVYTVDFHWTVNGETFDYSIPGGDCASLRELLGLLNMVADDPETEVDELYDFMAGIKDVAFSDPGLVQVNKIEEDTTVGALRAALQVESEYSAALTDEQRTQIDARALTAPDWALFSLRPFSTRETLTVTMENGDAFDIAVTDAQITTRVLTADGERFIITLDYTPEAMIPLDAELKATEIEKGTVEWDLYCGQARQATGIELGCTLDFARFFDIEILKDGEKIEPRDTVSVSITLADAPQDRRDDLMVVHYTEDGPVVMPTEAVADFTGEAAGTADAVRLTFETGSFSVYGVINSLTEPSLDGLDGQEFTISHEGRYMTSVAFTWLGQNQGQDVQRIWKSDDVRNAAIWHFELTQSEYHRYNIYTYVNGEKKYLNIRRITTSAPVYNADLVLSDSPQAYIVSPNNGSYNICTYIDSQPFYINDHHGGAGDGFAAYTSPDGGSLLTLDFKQVVHDDQTYMVVLQKGEKYYIVLNDGKLEEVIRTVEDGVEKFVVSNPMMWTLEKKANTENEYYINHQAFVKRTDYYSLPSEWYYRYITPNGSTGDTQCLSTDTVMPVVKNGESTTYPDEWAANEALKENSRVIIDRENNRVMSPVNNMYLAVNESGTGMVPVSNANEAAAVYFASTDHLKVQDNQIYLRRYNLVNHIDIEINAYATLTVPLGNAKVYDVNHNVVNIPDNVLKITAKVEVEPQDLKNATITAYTKGDNGVKQYLDNAYTITGYSGNAPIGKTDTQVRVEGRFLVSNYFKDYADGSSTKNAFLNEDTASQEELEKRYRDRVFYDVSTRKKVTFNYVYKEDPNDPNDEGTPLYDAAGNPLSTESIVELTSSFDYWDPANACPVVHKNWNPQGDFEEDWKAYRIPGSANGGSGMDFTIGADEERKLRKPGIMITKYIYDEHGNIIELQNPTRNEFDIYQLAILEDSTAESVRSITDRVRNVNVDVDNIKLQDCTPKKFDNDTQQKQPPQAYADFVNTHSLTVNVAETGTGTNYDFSVEPGMVYIREKDVQDSITDKNGIVWTYQYTVIKSEYVKRESNDREERYHYTRKMTDRDNLNSVPDVVGRYFKDDDDTAYNSASMEFYVYNVYRQCTTGVEVEKDWKYEDGTDYTSLTDDDYADVCLGRYKLQLKSDYSYSDRKIARVKIYQMNHNPDYSKWFENNCDLRAGDDITLKLRIQKGEPVRYSVNGGAYSDWLAPEAGHESDDLYTKEIPLTIPEDGILSVSVDDEYGGLWNAGRVVVMKGGTVIPSRNDGNTPETSGEIADWEYVVDTTDGTTPWKSAALRLNNQNGWKRTLGELEPYDENGNPYKYFIIDEVSSPASIAVIGTTDKGEKLTSTGFDEDPTLRLTNSMAKSMITIHKTDTDSRPLPGAEFSLSVLKKGVWEKIRDHIVVEIPENGADAEAVIPNLYDGRYKLTEEKAPDGYIIRNKDVYFTIVQGDAKLTKSDGSAGEALYNNMIEIGNGLIFTIQNEPGVRLPSTGGVGTTVFYVAGGLITLLALALLIARRRAD
ncbi:MAG: LPXTG cell wall anchor domain-containing protein [Clostridia bacterium]|nr:LPXTG cell wall anchor domain-containing protein [Clostridia bacterium]